MHRVAFALLLALPLAARPAQPEVPASARGASGALRIAIVNPGAPLEEPAGARPAGRYRWVSASAEAPAQPARGELRAPEEPGAWDLEVAAPGSAYQRAGLRIVVPVALLGRARVDGYVVGRYPDVVKPPYAPPEWLIRVTPALADLPVSASFRIRDFLSKGQDGVWPKYLALDLRLVDKLELIRAELVGRGVAPARLHVMSGYRTPSYNGPGENGRARLSRHMYGDAADVWVDDDGDGQMDDLNRDGRLDVEDARFLAGVAEAVELRHPELAGGIGTYPANGYHGPFTHVDARGSPARWRYPARVARSGSASVEGAARSAPAR